MHARITAPTLHAPMRATYAHKHTQAHPTHVHASAQVISEIDSLLEKQAINLKNEEANALRQLKLRLSEVSGGRVGWLGCRR